MQIYVQHQSVQTGPFSREQIMAGLVNGTYQPTDLAWHEGVPGWVPLSTLPGITGTPPPLFPGTSASSKNSALAVWSLVLGLLAFMLAGITAIPAVICGHIALGKINRSAGNLTGRGLAIAGLVSGYLGFLIFMIAIMAAMVTPMIVLTKTKAERSATCSNIRQIGVALAEFEINYGKYPNDSTFAEVAKNTHTKLLTGTSSNAYFRQLIRAGIISSEMPFYVHTQHSVKPDNVMDGKHLLAAGECGFAYVLGTASATDKPRPMVMTPFIPGTNRFDPKPFNGAAVILWTDHTVTTPPINRQTGEVMQDGRNLLDPTNPIWGENPPVIALPE